MSSVKAQDEEQQEAHQQPSWHNAVAGGVAGAGSRIATAPLDLVRIRRQLAPRTQYPTESIWKSIRYIVRTEGGATALYRGNAAAICLWIGYAAVQFSVYQHLKEWTIPSFGAGALAGVCATLITYPFDVCRTTFAARGIQNPLPFSSLVDAGLRPPTRPPASLREFSQELYRAQGIRGFYAGVRPALIQIVPYMGLSFGIYDFLSADSSSVGVSAYAGSVSGAASKLAVYPLDTIKRRLQGQAFFRDSHLHIYAGMWDCGKRILTMEGVFSFYRGVVPSVLKTTIATSLSFALYRGTKNTLQVLQDTQTNK